MARKHLVPVCLGGICFVDLDGPPDEIISTIRKLCDTYSSENYINLRFIPELINNQLELWGDREETDKELAKRKAKEAKKRERTRREKMEKEKKEKETYKRLKAKYEGTNNES